MNTEILRIIEGGLSNDRRKIITYSNKLADRLQAEGDKTLAGCIKKKIQESSATDGIVADALRNAPVDNDSRLQMVEIVPPVERTDKIILNPMTTSQVDEFINIVNNNYLLENEGLSVTKTLLLYGRPGCGKTSIAHYIAQQTKLPLVVARLDGLVSSLLGSTSKNIRRIFDYAKDFPCILFLDEFDAIAKARDDKREIGELKRVINSLLQNIDTMPKNCILLAATNHPELLDRAVWRRFIQKIEVPMPSEQEIMEMIREFSKPFQSDFGDNAIKLKNLTQILSNASPSDIKSIFERAKIKCIIDGSRIISLAHLLLGVYELQNDTKTEEGFVKYLNSNGISQRNINEITKISLRQIKKYLSIKSSNSSNNGENTSYTNC